MFSSDTFKSIDYIVTTELSNEPIAIFDSGLGSLSIVKEMRTVLPLENIVYLADTKNFPYGIKSQETLKEIVIRTIRSLEHYEPKLIIVASYTPSVQFLTSLKECTSIPVLGINPPLSKAALLTKKRHIGIMATESTLKSTELHKQIAKEIPQKIFVSMINASPLIDTIENCSFIRDMKIRKSVTRETFLTSPMENIDVVMLCSTHLSLIKDFFDSLYSNVIFVDSAHNVAKEAEKFLKENNILKKVRPRKTSVFTTGDEKKFRNLLEQMGFRCKVESFPISI
jgi:glutamate racemase